MWSSACCKGLGSSIRPYIWSKSRSITVSASRRILFPSIWSMLCGKFLFEKKNTSHWTNNKLTQTTWLYQSFYSILMISRSKSVWACRGLWNLAFNPRMHYALWVDNQDQSWRVRTRAKFPTFSDTPCILRIWPSFCRKTKQYLSTFASKMYG